MKPFLVVVDHEDAIWLVAVNADGSGDTWSFNRCEESRIVNHILDYTMKGYMVYDHQTDFHIYVHAAMG